MIPSRTKACSSNRLYIHQLSSLSKTKNGIVNAWLNVRNYLLGIFFSFKTLLLLLLILLTLDTWRLNLPYTLWLCLSITFFLLVLIIKIFFIFFIFLLIIMMMLLLLKDISIIWLFDLACCNLYLWFRLTQNLVFLL